MFTHTVFGKLLQSYKYFICKDWSTLELEKVDHIKIKIIKHY